MSEQTYRCDLCGEPFDTEDGLRAHWEQSHETREPIGVNARA